LRREARVTREVTVLDPQSPSGGSFDGLLAAMPRIAEAVNAFKSEENQRVAFNVLVHALGLDDGPPTDARPDAEPNLSVVPTGSADSTESSDLPDAQRGEQKPQGGRQRRSRKPTGKKSWSAAKDINFRPEDKQSLRDFVAEKQPGNLHEKNLVTVFYLEDVLGFASVDVGHVLAAYHECEWKPAADPENCLQVTASAKKWLDTRDMKAIRVTYPGRNRLRFDMPVNKIKKSA
jgi:hypothetical protein